MSRVITEVRFFVHSELIELEVRYSWPMNIDGSTKEGGVAARYVVQKMMMLEVTPKTICHVRATETLNINSFQAARMPSDKRLESFHVTLLASSKPIMEAPSF